MEPMFVKPATGPYPEPKESSSLFHTTLLCDPYYTVFPSTSRSSKRSTPLRFPDQKFLYF
jgi:hypothetical protein